MEQNAQSSNTFGSMANVEIKEEISYLKSPQNCFIKSESTTDQSGNEYEEDLNSKIVVNTLIEQEDEVEDKADATPSNSGRFSWPSLWKNGPRRSAFQPYKPTREAACSRADVEPEPETSAEDQRRPASTTVMTNLQRGNMKAEDPPAAANLSWFVLAGRGDLSDDLIQTMISQDKDVDAVDEEGLSALMWAAYHGQSHTVGLLLRAGLRVDRQGMWGETALMLAAGAGRLEAVRLLLEAGADINHEDDNHSTALMCAVHGDHPHTVSELLLNGADLWVHNDNDVTAYDIAVDQRSHRSKAVIQKYIASIISSN